LIQACSAKTQEGVWEGMAQVGDSFDSSSREEGKSNALPSLRYEHSAMEDP